jgi:hypothetical protein
MPGTSSVSSARGVSAWTAKANKRVQFGYGLNYLIDVEHAIIVDVEATPARTYDEVASTKTMIEQHRSNPDYPPGGRSSASANCGRAVAHISPPLYRTSRRWRCIYSARQQAECVRRLRKRH